MPSRRILLALGGLVALHVALAAAWIAYQELPQGGRDEFFIVEVATDLAYRLADGAGWSDLRAGIADAYYPPLSRIPGVLALLLGGGYDAMIVAQWVLWLPLLVGGTFAAGRRVGGDAAGLVAVAILLAGPAIADGLHRYEPNLGATAAAAAALAAWLHSDDFSRARPSLAFGVFVALGLMTDRLGTAPFFAAPVVWSLVRARGRGCWRGLGLAGLAVVLLCGWWYFDFLQRFARELLPQLVGGELGVDGEALIEDQAPALWYWLHYLVLWPDTQLGLVGGALALAAVVWTTGRLNEPAVRDVALFVGVGLLLFTLTPKRQAYYTMPLLPAVAALTGGMLGELLRRRPATDLLVAVLLVAASVPSVLNVRPGLVDLDRGLASWALLGQSSIQEWLLVQRYPMGGPPQRPGVDAPSLVQTLRAAGVTEGEPIVALSLDSQVSESFLISLLRIERADPRVYGVTRHPELFVSGEPPAVALVVASRNPGWPEAAAVRAEFEGYYGWDEAYRPVLVRLDELSAGAGELDRRPLGDGETLSVWRLPHRPPAAPAQTE